jgi:hypothetical protein
LDKGKRKMEIKKQTKLIVIIIVVVSFCFGLMIGHHLALYEVVLFAHKLGFVEINKQVIDDALFRYSHHLKGGFEPNALICNYTGD